MVVNNQLRVSMKKPPKRLKRALIITSILFGLIHFNFIGCVFFAFVVSALYAKTRTLWIPIFCHAVHNIIVASLKILGGCLKCNYEQFQWIGIICLVLSGPWVIWFSYSMVYSVNWKTLIPLNPFIKK